MGQGSASAQELLDPTSQVWAGAQGLLLRFEDATTLLTTDVIASVGDGQTAAASHADGRIQLFGLGNCTALTMPGRHPAYGLALGREGAVLAAWAQGVHQFVFFDLEKPGCPATTIKTALQGRISMTLSSSGAFLAVQDAAGAVWVGQRGAQRKDEEPEVEGLRHVATLSGAPAAIGFSEGEGVLLVLDAQGRGGSWNPRNGKALRTLNVPGGPFVRGEFRGMEARLWTAGGKLVRWDVLHNMAASGEGLAQGQTQKLSGSAGWLELRGTELYAVRPGKAWQPKPLYAPQLPQLMHSARAACLRLADVDGQVRYFDARTGLPQPQCLAEDWAPVALQPDGTARIPGLNLRVFDTIARADAGAKSGSKLNVRAISETLAHLWADHQPDLSIRVEIAPQATTSMLQKAAQAAGKAEPETLAIPLRQGIGAQAPSTTLRIK